MWPFKKKTEQHVEVIGCADITPQAPPTSDRTTARIERINLALATATGEKKTSLERELRRLKAIAGMEV